MPCDGGSRAAVSGGLARGNDVCKAGCSCGWPERLENAQHCRRGWRVPQSWILAFGSSGLDKTQLFPKLKACARALLCAFGYACSTRCVIRCSHAPQSIRGLLCWGLFLSLVCFCCTLPDMFAMNSCISHLVNAASQHCFRCNPQGAISARVIVLCL